MLVTRKDPFTGEMNTHDLDVTPRELKLYVEGDENGDSVYIQDALPRLNADEREFIKTGINIGAWDKVFEKDNEDNEDDEDYSDDEYGHDIQDDTEDDETLNS